MHVKAGIYAEQGKEKVVRYEHNWRVTQHEVT